MNTRKTTDTPRGCRPGAEPGRHSVTTLTSHLKLKHYYDYNESRVAHDTQRAGGLPACSVIRTGGLEIADGSRGPGYRATTDRPQYQGSPATLHSPNYNYHELMTEALTTAMLRSSMIPDMNDRIMDMDATLNRILTVVETFTDLYEGLNSRLDELEEATTQPKSNNE